MEIGRLPIAFCPEQIAAEDYKKLITYFLYVLDNYEKGYTEIAFSLARDLDENDTKGTLITTIEQKKPKN